MSTIPFQMLDDLVTNVFFADKDFKLQYINKTAKRTLDEIQDVIKDEFGVDVKKIIGINIDKFHGDRIKEIRSILNKPSNFPYSAEINVGELVLDLNINAHYDKEGEHLGFVVNWEEISEKKKIEDAATRSQQMVDKSPINLSLIHI